MLASSCNFHIESTYARGEASPDPIAGQGITVSAKTGAAPHFVHFLEDFDANAAPSAAFHAFDYSWNFNDPDSGSWGTTGKPKDSAKGGVAAHVFEKADTYEVRMTVKDGAGGSATCVTDTTHTSFDGAPTGSRQISTDDLSSITEYATAGSRILFARGSSWTKSGLTWPNNAGPVTIGAFGTGSGQDASGLYSNAPMITVTGGSFLPLDRKQNWRIMDLSLNDPVDASVVEGGYGSIGGDTAMQDILQFRLRVSGFRVGLGWSHWNDPAGMQADLMAVVSCDVSQSCVNIMYVGGERLALLGNTLADAHQSHVLRVWQAYQGVISDNVISGASVDSGTGRLALKLHGPISANGRGSTTDRTSA